MAQNSTRKVLALARKLGVLRPRDLRAAGLRREYVQRLLARGEIERIGRGLYAAPATYGGGELTRKSPAPTSPNRCGSGC